MKVIVLCVIVCFVGLTCWSAYLDYELTKFEVYEHWEKESKLIIHGIEEGKEMIRDSLKISQQKLAQ